MTFFTSCGDVLIKPKNFQYPWCDNNLKAINDKSEIDNFDIFISKFVFFFKILSKFNVESLHDQICKRKNITSIQKRGKLGNWTKVLLNLDRDTTTPTRSMREKTKTVPQTSLQKGTINLNLHLKL